MASEADADLHDDDSGSLALAGDHGCFTGDCPDDGHDCIEVLRAHAGPSEDDPWTIHFDPRRAVAPDENIQIVDSEGVTVCFMSNGPNRNHIRDAERIVGRSHPMYQATAGYLTGGERESGTEEVVYWTLDLPLDGPVRGTVEITEPMHRVEAARLICSHFETLARADVAARLTGEGSE